MSRTAPPRRHEGAGARNGRAADRVPPPQPKQARSELSTRRLLDAAADLIAEVGYDRATLAAIGERAGYSHGLVTRRFVSKENLLESLLERMTFSWEESVLRPAVAAHVGVDALEIVIDAIQESVRTSPREMRALYTLMFEALKQIPVLRERMVVLHRGFASDVTRHVRHGIDAGVVRPDVEPESAARLFIATLRGSAYLWLLDPELFDLDAALDDLRVHVNASLRAGAATPVPADLVS